MSSASRAKLWFHLRDRRQCTSTKTIIMYLCGSGCGRFWRLEQALRACARKSMTSLMNIHLLMLTNHSPDFHWAGSYFTIQQRFWKGHFILFNPHRLLLHLQAAFFCWSVPPSSKRFAKLNWPSAQWSQFGPASWSLDPLPRPTSWSSSSCSRVNSLSEWIKKLLELGALRAPISYSVWVNKLLELGALRPPISYSVGVNIEALRAKRSQGSHQLQCRSECISS
jgi:hypothetical protein